MNNEPKSLENLVSALNKLLIKTTSQNDSSPHLEDLVKLLMESLSRGEIYLKIDEVEAQINLKGSGWPNKHMKVLLDSGWINKYNSPMVLQGNYLSWRRWSEEMQNVIDQLTYKSFQQRIKKDQNCETLTRQGFSALNLEQLSAVEAISNHNLILLSGGPGTGKTHTIVNMLIKALSIHPNLKIGLGAPTGKATRRLEETIQQSSLNLDEEYKIKLAKIPCLTLHRWLQAVEGKFLKGKKNKLQLDILVIDEMSMVDLSLMQAVLNALPKESQLILVGDPDQLAPVGNGAVWHKLQEESTREIFKHCAIHLSKLYRTRGEVASLAKVIRNKGLSCFFMELKNIPSSSNVNVLSSTKEVIPIQIVNKIKEHQNKLRSHTKEARVYLRSNPTGNLHSYNQKLTSRVLDCLEELIVLCPRRHGLWGIEHIHQTILGNQSDEGVSSWPEGTPVICGANQSEIHLANGDIGVVIGEDQNKKLLFRVNSLEKGITTQLIHPARVKSLEPAFATTIHKAQGSEAEHVICLWPDPINTKESANNELIRNENYERRLIYTAITRARTKLDLVIS
ncbi:MULTISPECIES: AAA family ATPase [Prochlorococcus]|uniref:ATP-dependent exoDNAse alpha subunit n=1 Tax=Prochlorococcus marinus (strain SARG / CCMP1375 / SS120) TaxID=167539 RepID=Q7VBJ9_PROMA|nr:MULTISPECIES: AAA family ATPase [Prochlorococcus]AAQ00138.1 ATP-dependent exoDNAse alpha subunit [Prochlorococcus marinus subsp. marinus str. CCMP1375]KGG13934.1 Exodeoxyribonuclease V alpha chain [Prochlorococcus marinus str. LG]KGG19067.1 Exodeoxyribonuclease V alpha chain [Prochlorococcus marinus str. SS2]KGG23393.1 Exodeoxyribonuclease V alpha chain [Prochlorococcus marinus str. SS35]KGG32371.1 Exodeoxyribonuclease V alpha chain [Prochlorococcus marinus str. SS51]